MRGNKEIQGTPCIVVPQVPQVPKQPALFPLFDPSEPSYTCLLCDIFFFLSCKGKELGWMRLLHLGETESITF